MASVGLHCGGWRACGRGRRRGRRRTRGGMFACYVDPKSKCGRVGRERHLRWKANVSELVPNAIGRGRDADRGTGRALVSVGAAQVADRDV